MSINSPIGIFDSGFGGLTVVKRALERLPQESIAFIGDQAHIPYGEKSPLEIQSYALGICKFLIEQNSKLIIMACNMSSATALQQANALFPHIPIIGVIEAGVRAAIQSATGGPIGILATTGTVKTGAYTKALTSLMPEAVVIEQACPKFVPLIEAGMCDSPEAEDAVREYTDVLRSAGCRTIILGCTHYPFLTDVIRKVIGSDIAIINPAEETAIEAANILSNAGMLNPQHAGPIHSYYTSDRPDQFAELGSRFLGRTIGDVRKIIWGLDLRAIECQEKMDEKTTNSAR